ncbi:hypothetical protein BP5796_01379 [Coleophoma crateriformis]|uniref:Tyrosyl-DNA phosphodiesterase n=1 Tax=Coleophoma crateriformis TaxID=565419 RepID=A0A3D8T092_9HELO|nr:hypothetical protein BP5796_01379 [Coleophoma crateriformis]
MADEQRANKRQKLNANVSEDNDGQKLSSLHRPISPPPRRAPRGPKVVNSPFQLTSIRDLPPSMNVDTVSLKDILGDPLIAECWEFNYLHDVDFLMEAFDEDVRDLVKVHVVHGFWKREDQSRKNIEEQASKYQNVTLHTAYMPEMFGTHHSKMLVLFRHDSTAQIIIHTANMIAFDWTNMAQAVWKSPLLPTLPELHESSPDSRQIGSGSRFKADFINYLKAYDTKRKICKSLIEQISVYDFSEIRAALIASVPGKQGIETNAETAWGWTGLKNVLNSVPVQNDKPEIIVQVSSIATLGPSDKWLKQTLFGALGHSQGSATKKPSFKVVFPTPDEIRRSLNGYSSGSAIHIRLQSTQQAKQLQYLKPLLCHWAGDGAQHTPAKADTISEAGRRRAAPHIKTYIRFADHSKTAIDWALVTSANLSKQAWGDGISGAGDVRICSYEIGVMVWPGLYGEKAKMVPTFKTDSPTVALGESAEAVVGVRMPYDLPLVPYGKDDTPWCATASYSEPDWLGQAYNV